jgi:dihydropteroate synthase
MAIVNCTPDSISNAQPCASAAIALAEQLVAEGADILDVGGESTRPGAAPVSAETELARVLPVIQHISKKFPGFPISIDTYRSATAWAAVAAGAQIINDVSGGLADSKMNETAVSLGAHFICMHVSSGENLHTALNSPDPSSAVAAELRRRVEAARAAGLPAWDISIDPGFGFGKTEDQNWQMVDNPPRVGSHPVVVGVSRKRFLRGSAESTSVEALAGTAAVVARLAARSE